MFEQTSYRSPARHEPMTSFHRWSSLSTLSYNQKCYTFYLWECGCVGTLTTEAPKVQRGEEGEEGGQRWGDQNYGWSVRRLGLSSYPELVAYHPRLTPFMKHWARRKKLACSYDRYGLKIWPSPHMFCFDTRIRTTSLSLNYWSPCGVLSDGWKPGSTILGGGWTSSVPFAV